MTIDLTTLKCGECGSGALQRTGPNQFTCAHCGSVTVMQDDVSQRLERVLQQVKGEAARQLAAEQSARSRATGRKTVTVVVVGGLALVATGVLSAILASRRPPVIAPAAGERRSVVSASSPRPVPVSDLRLDTPREVLVGSGSSARPQLLVTMRNDSDRPVERPTVKATFHDGANLLGERSAQVPIGLLAPGESAPLLIDLPSGPPATRQELTVQRPGVPDRAATGPRLAFSRVRLVQQGDRLSLVGRVANTRADGTLASVEVLATLYDERGAVTGFGHGYTQAGRIAPGGRSDVELRLQRFGSAPVAAWDYRIGYRLEEDAGSSNSSSGGGGGVPVVAADRVIRSTSAPEVFHPDLRLGSADLLADESERFDVAQLELAPLVAGRDTTQDPVYLTELVNRSADTVVLAPGAVVSRYDGNQLDGSGPLAGPAYLYPGERFPVLLTPRRAGRITATRLEWKPAMRRAALPGPRLPLEVTVSGTRADTGSVLVNFSQRYSYRFATVSGSVKNPGAGIVRKARLWVSLRDRDGRLTGFSPVDDLPAIGPGDSVPFEVRVDQFGRDFIGVSTLYQTE